MPFDHQYFRDERLLIRGALVLGLVVGGLAFILAKLSYSGEERIPPEKVWAYVEKVSAEKGLDSGFVYALAWAESSLNAKARSPVARGMMQLTKSAWREVSDKSYRRAWNWKTNIRVATDYLAFCRDFLEKHGAFSYPLLAASYRYGPYYVKKRGFDLSRIRTPKNKIYQDIFNGTVRPVSPPL